MVCLRLKKKSCVCGSARERFDSSKNQPCGNAIKHLRVHWLQKNGPNGPSETIQNHLWQKELGKVGALSIFFTLHQSRDCYSLVQAKF